MPSSASSMAKLADGPTKGVQCSVCGKRFSRTDHLKRHQLRRKRLNYDLLICNWSVLNCAESRSRFRGQTLFLYLLQWRFHQKVIYDLSLNVPELTRYSDNLRDHYPTCPQRKNRSIPEAARGGRRSHACDSVSPGVFGPCVSLTNLHQVHIHEAWLWRKQPLQNMST